MKAVFGSLVIILGESEDPCTCSVIMYLMLGPFRVRYGIISQYRLTELYVMSVVVMFDTTPSGTVETEMW